ncbi:MAG TPA: hypothetical protein VGM91_20425 [Conexibacter sp.]|jgi:hypothetical protein
MDEDTLVLVIFGGLHLVGFAFAAILLYPLMREERAAPWTPPEEDDNGGGNDRVSPRAPRPPSPGGLPLPDAIPAGIRLRGPERLGDLAPRPARRPAHTPTPQRVPVRRN